MRARRALAAAALAVALLGAFASEATALAPAPALFARTAQLRDELALLGGGSEALGIPRKRALSELKFTNRDGYTITVLAFGQTVALSVGNQSGVPRGKSSTRSSTTTYLAHGKVTPTSIHASFADRGRIALRFRSSGRSIRASRQAGCNKPSGSVVARLGLFVGALRFHGEGGYTAAEAHRIHGGVVDYAALAACLAGAVRPGQLASSSFGLAAFGTAARLRAPAPPSVPTHPSRGNKPTTLVAERKLPVSRTAFAARLGDQGRSRFVALAADSVGSVGILRFVLASASPSAFTADDSLSAATVKPPAPFSGAAAFQHGPGSAKSWTGSLAVSFLGAPHVPLTGDSFSPQLVRGW